MVSTIADKIQVSDVICCFPGVGTLVGIVEAIYHLGHILYYSPIEREERNTYLYNLNIDAGKLQQHCAETFIAANQNKPTPTAEKINLSTKRCFQGILKATWVGAIGLLVYKLSK